MADKESVSATTETKPTEEAPSLASPTASNAETTEKSKFGMLKLAFLYVLVGGLVISALISVVAILIGEFNSTISKAIYTTVSLVIHSSLMLLVVLADKNNQLGKSIVPTTFLVAIVANMITSSLGLWDVLSDDISWRMVNVYAFLIGITFLVDGLLRLRLQKQGMQMLSYVSIGLVLLLAACFTPWILFFDASWMNDVYYRIIGATAILAVTAVVVTSIVNRILVSQHPELVKSAPKPEKYSQGMLGIVIPLGIIVSFFWFFGLFSFIYQATTYDERRNTPRYEQREHKSGTYRYE